MGRRGCRPGDPHGGRPTALVEELPEIAIDTLKGGSPALPFEGGWLLIVHEWELIRNRRRYLHRLVWLDPTLRVSRLSQRFRLADAAVEFAAGLACTTALAAT